MNFSKYIGRKVVFMESGQMCLAKVVEADLGVSGFRAVFVAVQSPATSNQLHQFCKSADENLVKSWSETAVFGERWSVFVGYREFLIEEYYWQASTLWGGGFRVFLDPLFIERFMQRDLSWLESFFKAEDLETETIEQNGVIADLVD
jgi:hypothetical protein